MKPKTKTRLLILTVIGAVFFILNLLADNPYTHQLVRMAINDKMAQSTNLALSYKAVKISAIPLQVDLYGFKLEKRANVPTGIDRTLVAATHVAARVSLWSLFMGKPRLSLVEINDLDATWPPPFPVDDLLKDQTPTVHDEAFLWPPDLADLPVDRLIVTNVHVYMEFPTPVQIPEAPTVMAAAVDGLDLDIGFSGWSDIDLEASARRVNLAQASRSLLEDAAVDLHAHLVGKTVSVDRLNVKGERIDLGGRLRLALITEQPLPSVKSRFSRLQRLRFEAGLPAPVRAVNLSGDLKANGDLSLLGSFLDIGDTRGQVTAQAKVKAYVPLDGTAQFSVAGAGKVKNGILGGFHLFDSATGFSVDANGMTFSDTKILRAAHELGTASGRLAFDDPLNFHFTLRPEALRLSELLGALNVPFDALDFTMQSQEVEIKGRGDPFLLTARGLVAANEVLAPSLNYPHRRYTRAPSCRLELSLSTTDERLDFTGTHGTCAAAKGTETHGRLEAPLSLAGYITYDEKTGMDLKVLSPSFGLNVAAYYAQVPLDGSAAVEARIHGPLSAVLVDVNVRGDKVGVDGLHLGRVSGKFRVDDSSVRWRDLEATPNATARLLSSEGRLGFGDDLPLSASLEASHLDTTFTGDFIHIVAKDTPLTFSVESLAATVQGPLLFPLAYQGLMRFDLTHFVYAGDEVLSRAKGSAKADSSGWSVDQAALRFGTLQTNLGFRLRRRHPFERLVAETARDVWTSLGISRKDSVHLDLKSVTAPGDEGESTNQLQALPLIGPSLRAAGMGAQLRLALTLSGSVDRLEGTFKGGLDDLTVLGSQIAPLGIEGFVHGGKLDAFVHHGGNALEGRISLNLFADGLPFEWYLQTHQLDMRAFATKTFAQDPRNFAYLSADWQMQGKLLDWWHAKGTLAVKDFTGQYSEDSGGTTHKLMLQLDQPTTIAMSEQGWQFADGHDLLLNSKAGSVRVSLPGNRPPEQLSVKLDGIVNLAILTELTNAIESATGQVRVLATLTGSVSDPKFAADITDVKRDPFNAATWKEVSLGLADARPPLQDVTMHLSVRDDHLLIDTFKAGKGSGRLAASGVFYPPGARTADGQALVSNVAVTFNDAAIVYPLGVLKTFDSALDGTIMLSGTGFPYRLSGDVAVTRARSSQDFDIRKEILNALRKKQFATDTVKSDPLVNLDLHLRADNTIAINNQNIQAILGAKLWITGTDADPVVNGQVEVAKGKFIYKRDFKVLRGLVTFDDPFKLDPRLDILAESEVANYRVDVAITGRASNARVDLTADPPTRDDGTPLSKMDIVELLSTGALPVTNQNQVADPNYAARTARTEALNILVGQFEEPIDKLFDLTGQDVVRQVYIDTYASDIDGSPEGRVNVPINLANDLDLVIRYDQAQNFVLSSEYSLHDSISLSGSIDNQNTDKNNAATTTTTQQGTSADTTFDLRFHFNFD